MPSSATDFSIADSAADGTRSSPAGPTCSSSCSRPSADAVASTGTGRVWGTAVGIAPRLTPCVPPRRGRAGPGDAARASPPGLLPTEVGFGAGEHQDVSVAEPTVPQRELRPRELAQTTVDHVQHRPARTEGEKQGS